MFSSIPFKHRARQFRQPRSSRFQRRIYSKRARPKSMAQSFPTDQDAITEAEITGSTAPSRSKDGKTKSLQKRNAFAELMSPTPKSIKYTPPQNAEPEVPILFAGRYGLGSYIADPASFPASRVIYDTDKWVVIHDLYPKSSVHLLLLPRNPEKSLLHPFEALEDVQFLAEVQGEVKRLRSVVAKELRRKYGKYSKKDKAREEAIDVDPPPNDLPEGRDWEKEVISGVHAHPSMNHLHVHILSVDRHSECMRHRKHYNSFATPFLIGVEDFPLAIDDVRRHPGREGYLARDMLCWRCGKNFKNKFGKLKEHLGEEFEQWKEQ